MTISDQLEQNRGFRLILADIGEVIEDQQMETIEPADGRLKPEFAARDLEFLHQVGGAGEQYAPAVFDQCEADSRGQVRLAAAGRTRDILPAITNMMGGSTIATIPATGRPWRF